MSQKPGLGLGLTLSAVLVVAGSAHAGLSDSAFVAFLPDQLPPFENAEFVYNGRQYCWYEDGWRGPGWYWCGYAHWEGAGWGGAYGWNGWRTGDSLRYRAPPRHRKKDQDGPQ